MAKRKGRGDDGSGRGAGRSGAVIEDVSLAEATRSRFLNYAPERDHVARLAGRPRRP